MKVLLILSVSLQTVVTSANTALVDKIWGGRLANAGDKLTYSVRVAGIRAGVQIISIGQVTSWNGQPVYPITSTETTTGLFDRFYHSFDRFYYSPDRFCYLIDLLIVQTIF